MTAGATERAFKSLRSSTHDSKSSVLCKSGNALPLSLESDIKSRVKFILKHRACGWDL